MTSLFFYFAAGLIGLIGVAHSYLGERYILMRLFRRGDLPRLFGGTEFTQRTLRFAWHLTTVAWGGLAVVLILLARPPVTPAAIATVIGVVFGLHFLVAAMASRGRHLSWIVFLLITGLVLGAASRLAVP